MKKILFCLVVLFFSGNLFSQTITKSSGWLESAFVEWSPVPGADSYNVYYTGGGQTNKKIEDQLIRSYGTYFRADVLGLAAGNYTITIKPVISSVEGAGTTTASLTVLAQDRTGFAFAGGRIPGGYNLDGTLKTGAVVLYITQNTKNTITMNVTGATTNPCVGLQTILDGFKKGSDTRPLVVRLIGNITTPTTTWNGDIVIENKNNASSSITLEGVGTDAVANGWGIRIKTGSNIEIRNLGFMLTDAAEGDNVGLQQANDHIWVHNCDLFYGSPGGDADQIKGDGAMDCKKSTYVTFSYNHFWDSGKCNLLGLSEGTTSGLYITYHHNWYDHSDSRHPRVRYYSAHVYNNYYDGNSKYGAGSTLGSSVFMEGNFFRNCKYPMLTSQQGTDVYNGAVGTFSGEAGGTIKAFNNTMSGQTRYVPYNASSNPIEFDAIETTTRGEVISSSITSKLGANAYNNFDTDPTLYVKSLIIDEPAVAKDKVIQYSGRVSGGDLKWTFNNAVDDVLSDINVALKSALTNYTTGLVFVQGETPAIPNTQTLTSTSNTNQTITIGSAISNIIYTWGGDATDANIPELTELTAAGISAVKNVSAKTITISGSPTADVTFSVVTNGTSGTPVTLTGSIVVGSATPSDEIHNFTASGSSSTFYTISGNLSTTKGTVTYDGLTLTQCLKMESATTITFTTTQASTLTLVMNTSTTDPTAQLKVDGTNYTNASGVITISLAAGSHTIAKSNSANLFYIKTAYATLGLSQNLETPKLTLYPNPVSNSLYLTSNQKIENVLIYNITGVLVKSISNNPESIDVSNLNSGSYLVKVTTNEGSFTQKIIKK
ncbi:pectate lyase [Flavobacterium alvei]|uniref:Pectate lyase n=1 Tax=Flavobacterium alvei TaxID=2080416 RepID=A0A2S5AE00_9FLAO|nr:T9SS type A sorting domain-containing protein [Flavobacterium alvei]POY40810.1 pectate lyase [Flavobacterium alvei]